MISPIASNAFQYYKYKLESTFFDESNHQINKIKVIPRRDKEPVFEGYIYIVEDSWAIYAVDFDIKGYRMRNEFTEVMTLKQNFNYNSKLGYINRCCFSKLYWINLNYNWKLCYFNWCLYF